MNAVLLTGAGFSHNWGGRLAREINTAVAMRLQHDAPLADLLHRNPNFEEALTELQNEVATSARPGTAERLQKLETAIVDAFAVMNRNLGAASFNFSNDLKYSLPEFFVFFDAIFTLNQDLLLEKHYLYPLQIIALAGTRRWLRGCLPGIDEIPNPAQSGLYDPLRARRCITACPWFSRPRPADMARRRTGERSPSEGAAGSLPIRRNGLLAGQSARRQRQEQRSGFGRTDSFAVIR
jgi:hypothetical protein